jgi:hypothetical protein
MEFNGRSPGRAISIPFPLKNDEIHSEQSLIKSIRRQVMLGEIIILKGVFSEALMLAFRAEVIKWGNANDVFAHGESPSKYPDLNYHRIDDGSMPSVCPHLFHQYGFNSISKLNVDSLDLFNAISTRLLLIQNAIGETSFQISLEDLRLKVLQYPEGGGFLTEHTHPKEPQQIGLILSLSRKNIDFVKGAAVFKTDKGHVDTEQEHDIGDVAIFRYDLPHAVSPVNPGKKSIDWTLDTGKWSVVLELRETHGLSHKKTL